MGKDVTIIDKTADALKLIKRGSDRAIREFGNTCREITHDNAPRRKLLGGTHARSIQYQHAGNGSGRLFSSSGYGVYLELGTSKMVARPHFRPAIDEAIKEFDRNDLWGIK